MKIGKHGYCGKPCKDALCHEHMLKSVAGCRCPLPCFVCGVGVKNSKPICKSCRLGENTRLRSLPLAKEFEEDWDSEPSIGSYAWHAKKTGGKCFWKLILHVSHALNDFACNISHVSMPLGSEAIFIDNKRRQVETNNHVLMICR